MKHIKIKHIIIVLIGTVATVATHTAIHNAPVPSPTPQSVTPESPTPAPAPAPQPAPVTQSGCDPALWAFVYHPARLPSGTTDCRTVTGVVKWDKPEPDGDFHIRLALDDPNSAPVNAKNIGGYLVVEPICQNTPTQADAIGPCSSYNGPHFPLPVVGSHISVTGFYTLDQQHGWTEMHTVNHLDVIP